MDKKGQDPEKEHIADLTSKAAAVSFGGELPFGATFNAIKALDDLKEVKEIKGMRSALEMFIGDDPTDTKGLIERAAMMQDAIEKIMQAAKEAEAAEVDEAE